MRSREDALFLRAVGEQVRESRLDGGLSQDRVADRAGLAKSSVSKVECGHRSGYNVVVLCGGSVGHWACHCPTWLRRPSATYGARRRSPTCSGEHIAGLLLVGADFLGWPGGVKGGACAVAPAMRSTLDATRPPTRGH